MKWYEDGRKVLAAAIVFAVAVGAWMGRYQVINSQTIKNRFTGAICSAHLNCW
jgi:hypothetical protein